MEDDASVDFSSLSREEILKKIKLLGINACTNVSTDNLRVKLRNLMKIHHPIHNYISQLTKEEVRNIFLIVFPMKQKQTYDRMRSSLANEFFKKYPHSPLTALMFCVENGKFPDADNLKQNFKKNDAANTCFDEKASTTPDMRNKPTAKKEQLVLTK